MLQNLKNDLGRIFASFLRGAAGATTATQLLNIDGTRGAKGILLSVVMAGGAAALRTAEALWGRTTSTEGCNHG